MAKKLKKKKTGMNPKAKFTLVSAVKGVISNQAVIDGSKESPWWVAAIFLVFSVIIPLIPGFVKISNSRGGSFISTYNYGFDTALTAVAHDMKEAGDDFYNEKGILHYYRNGSEYTEGWETPDDEYIENASQTMNYVDSNTNQYSLRVFFWSGLGSNKLSKYVNAVAKQKYKLGTRELPNPSDVDQKYYIPNILIITPKTMAIALYKNNGTKQVATSLGGLDWTNFSKKYGLIEYLLKDGEDDFNTLTKSQYINQYRGKTMKRMVKVLDNTYLNQKTRTLWSNTGIYAGIYAGIIAFLGLMIFILTRGKNNPFKYLNVWHCQKIAWWAGFTPALLGMILAFIFSGNMIGQMAFILLISLRVMWLSMKQLRPVYQQ